MKKEEIHVGQKVHYVSKHLPRTKENGIVKSISGNIVFVVYNCNGDWDNYANYTGGNTHIDFLHPGWVNEINNDDF